MLAVSPFEMQNLGILLPPIRPVAGQYLEIDFTYRRHEVPSSISKLGGVVVGSLQMGNCGETLCVLFFRDNIAYGGEDSSASINPEIL